ncbi:aspartate aminotransferase family protein [Halovenus rubra]|uniref:Aspartate aminotransferase family protein n=2 Tax=Halovenus rubra TaxID=869890 RepID=A0ACC7E0I1_9EURY|nr:acetylornithine/succinylornithine family transaminase [Halovenus rubra]
MSDFIYATKPIQVESGDGLLLTDDNGNEYLDFGASYACVPLGHSHEAVETAVTEQVSKLAYVQASYPVGVRTQLYETLGGAAPDGIDNVWLCNSGAEAVEAALKFARSATGNAKIISTMQAFHGRTMGALSATWKSKYKQPYEPLLDDVEFVPYNDSEALAKAVDDDTAAVILEPIQGEGGVNPATEKFLTTAREATNESGSALVFDEIQTGLGRTGELWACERTGVIPDIVTSAKGLANGLPIGATLCRDWIAEDYGSHASTFGGNPVVAAAADATVSTLQDDDIADDAAKMGTYLRESLERELGDAVRDVRGDGLMVGIELKGNAGAVARELAVDHQVLVLTAGRTVVRLLPPLVVNEADIDRAVNALGAVIT